MIALLLPFLLFLLTREDTTVKRLELATNDPRLARAIAAAASHYKLDPFLLAAISWRESRHGRALDSAGTGDNGHGHGIFQIDARFHAHALATIDWRDPDANARLGASILADSLAWSEQEPSIPEVLRLRAGIARYNASAASVLRGVAIGDPDAYTTGKNYSADVLNIAASYRLLQKETPGVS